MKLEQKNPLGPRRGNAMVEFALASVILFPIFIGTFQFGYSFYIYNLLTTQIRAGARYASMRTFNCADSKSIGKYKTAVQNMVVYGNSVPGASDPVIVSGLTVSQIDVAIKAADGTTDADSSHVPFTVTVATSSVTPFTIDAVFKTFSFSGHPILQFPYTGQFAPVGTE